MLAAWAAADAARKTRRRDNDGAQPVEFDSRKVLPVSAGQTPRVRVEGAWYSVPSTWAGLDVIARVGVSKVELRCRGESVERDRQSFGGKDIRYRDYLPELGRKPQAVRQVAPNWRAEHAWACPDLVDGLAPSVTSCFVYLDDPLWELWGTCGARVPRDSWTHLSRPQARQLP